MTPGTKQSLEVLGAIVAGAAVILYLRSHMASQDTVSADTVAAQGYPVYSGGANPGTVSGVAPAVINFDFSNVPPVTLPDISAYLQPPNPTVPVGPSLADKILNAINPANNSACGCGTSTGNTPGAWVSATPQPYLQSSYPDSSYSAPPNSTIAYPPLPAVQPRQWNAALGQYVSVYQPLPVRGFI